MTSTSAVDAEARCALRSDDKRGRRPPASADTADPSSIATAANAKTPHRHAPDAKACVAWAGFRFAIEDSLVSDTLGVSDMLGSAASYRSRASLRPNRSAHAGIRRWS